jgi:8-oxo-dGTP pyrophosphatase MutT (NUDIX family)
MARERREFLGMEFAYLLPNRLVAGSLEPEQKATLDHYLKEEAGDWVNIIPVTNDGKVVFVRQFRHGTQEMTLEIPGGMVDADDASPATAARREMVEEAGYDSPTIVSLGVVTPNPALLTNRCHTFLALDAKQIAVPTPGHFEDTIVELAPLAEVPDLIRGGRISHALVAAAFHVYELNRPRASPAGGQVSP